jgi:hypothetical protein
MIKRTASFAASCFLLGLLCVAREELYVRMVGFPQRLKPHFNEEANGTAEAAPLQSSNR